MTQICSTPPHRLLLTFCRPVVRRVPTCTTMACCCLVESTSSEAWNLYAARWPRKVTTLTPRTQRRMTRMSGGVAQTQTMQTGGKAAFQLVLSQMPKHLVYSFVSSISVSFHFSLKGSLPTPVRSWVL